MKLLVIGIDGGTTEIFDAFDMPFWKSLRAKSVTYDVTEDLNQRGWARMISGMGAAETGGLYMRPKLDGSRDFSISYGLKDLKKADGFKPIWELALDSGMRAGMMNVPTTSPAQSIEGFYVSGGGGGIMQGGLPDNALYPSSIAPELIKLGYIFDTRLGAQSFSTPTKLCEHLATMMQSRSRCFSYLAKKETIDFGFLAFRAPTVLLYLAMSEIATMMRYPLDDPRRRSWSGQWNELINTHMRILDDCLSEIFDKLQPDNFILTSDHSIVPWTHNIDFNGFLSEAGFADFSGSMKYFTRNVGKTILKRSFRKQIANSSLSDVGNTMWTAGASLARNARSFSNGYVYGIYVNDGERFGGPVSYNDIDIEVDEIVEKFNWIARIKQIPMLAIPYRRKYKDAMHQNILPDVYIEQSGHAFPSRLGANWYSPNPNFGPVKTLSGVKGMHSGQKGRHPILLVNKELASLKSEDDSTDLRLVYKLTQRLFSKESEI